ncbi:MAG TPA: ATP-binding protein [Pyrinomonadaceae bacterium]|jgi:PAS domain S-box-containing protein
MTEQPDNMERQRDEDTAEEASATVDLRRRNSISPVASTQTAAQTESAATLRKVVDMVRRIMRSDTASIVSFSVVERTIRWKAASGFRSFDRLEADIIYPLKGEIAELAAAADELMTLEAVAGELPASELPMHSAEGVRDMALIPLHARGERLGALIVGYRSAHRFTPDEKQLLEGLAEMAALALDNARLFETVGTAKKIWEQTFDAIPDGIIVHDEEMRIARCNREAAGMMGFDQPSEAIGMACADAFAHLFGERAAAYHMKQNTATASSFELQAEDGRRYLVSVAPLSALQTGVSVDARPNPSNTPTSSDAQASSETQTSPPVVAPSTATAREEVNQLLSANSASDASRTHHQTSWSVITWSDITELSEVQEQLARSRRLATVGQLAAGVAHEINNPLAAITTCAEATLRALRSVPETAALAEERNWNFYLEEIVRQALRCKTITRGLLDLSRQRRARREACDLNTLVERSVKFFEPRGQDRSIKFNVNLDPSISDVATDEAMVRQILDNLLSNALDAVTEGGEITVSTSLRDGRIAVEVADNGPGIPPETLARIFDPFFTTKEAGKGSGLGLAISITLAEAVGGALAVESKPGTGSCFRLWIPRRSPEK